MKRFETVVFDFDGTLADTLPLIFQVFQELIYHFTGRNASREDILKLFGPTEARLARQLFPHIPDEAVRYMLERYREGHDSLVKRLPAVNDTLHQLKKLGYHTAILTNKGRETLDLSLEKLGMKTLIDFSISGDDMINPKPAGEGLLSACKRAGSEPSRTLMIGDMDNDILCGRNAGVPTLAARWLHPGFFSIQADYSLERIEDLPGFLE